MTKRYILLTALTIAAFIRADQAPDNAAEATRAAGLSAGGQKLDKSTFYYAQTLSASDLASAAGKTLTAAGYYLLSGSATTVASNVTALTINGSNITVDLDGNAIIFGASSTNAISISTGAKNITIKNGTISGAFTAGAIVAAANVNNLLLENITIDGSVQYGVSITGSTCKNVTLRNVTVTGSTAVAASSAGIDLASIQGLTLENVQAIGGASSAACAGIKISTCGNITGTDIVSCNNASSSTIIGLNMVTCTNAVLKNVNVSNNNSSIATSSSGLVLSGCKNVTVSNLSADNFTLTLNNILIASSNNITLENVSACNSTGAEITSISMTGSQSVLLKNATIANNTSTAGSYIGIGTASTSKNITFDNVSVLYNITAAAANLYNMTGIDLADTHTVEILDSQVCNNHVSSATHSRSTKGLNAASSVADITIRNSQFNTNNGVTGSTTATGGLVAGIYLDSVSGCEIYNSQANRNFGTGRAYGFYVTGVSGLVMSGCTANSNAAAFANAANNNDNMAMMPQEGSQTSPDGIEALPSAGLYLLLCDYAEVKDCKFINNRAGNRAAGNLNAEGTPSVTSTCSGHGVANVGTTVVMMAVATLNIGNTFTRCIFQGNNTQIQDVAPAEPGMTYNGQNHWITETFAAGATEEFTSGTTYNDCLFNANGNSSKYVVGFGLCVFTGCNTLYVNNCTAATNGWYGFYDSTNAHIIALTGCISSMNGVGNSQATTAVGSANMRNYSLGGGVTPYKSVTVADFSQIAPTGSAYLNLSITP